MRETKKAEALLTRKLLSNKDKYFCWVVRPATVQRISILVKVWYKQFGTSTLNFYTHAGDTGYFFEKSKYRKFGQQLAKKFHSERFIKEHLALYRTYRRHLLGTGKRALIAKADPKSLLRLFHTYSSALGNFAKYFATPFSVDDYVFPELCEQLKEILPEDTYQKTITAIASPTVVFDYQKYQQALLKAKTAADYSRIVAKYRWVREYSFQETLLNTAMAVKDRQEIFKSGAQKEIQHITANCRRNRKRLEASLSRIRNPYLRLQAKLVNDYVNIKTERIEIYKKFQTDFRAFFYKLLALMKKDMLKVRYEHMISLTNDEIVAYLQRGVLPNLQAVMKRYSYAYVAASFRGKTHFIYEPKRIQKVKSAFLQAEERNEIHGNIVSKGKVAGKVKVIARKSDLSRIKAGQILVANFTTPEYVPAMKVAAGIVTDDGGITSHAAIISRELGKPCVTGTKVATQVFKDGDYIEVDADRGIVKKL